VTSDHLIPSLFPDAVYIRSVFFYRGGVTSMNECRLARLPASLEVGAMAAT
jgi:hypothetical protein